MIEKEKKAIEDLRKILFQTIQANECGLSTNDFKDEIKTYTDILNLIEKLKKENEELRQNYDTATTDIEELKKKLGLKQFDVNVVYNDYLEKIREFKSNYIPKEKIREKIKQLENKREQLGIFKSGIYVNEIYKISLIIAAYKELLEEE